MSEEKIRYGFVYIWFDRKHRRFYIGSHWGTEDDGYICSSRWMRKSYRRRPEDFKRRIIKTNILTKQALCNEEQRYLNMIKPEEIRIRYYNLVTRGGRWDKNNEKRKGHSKETKQRMSIAAKGKPKSQEHKDKIAATLTGRPTTDKQKQAASEYNLTKRNYSDPEFRTKMSEAAKNRSPEHRAKLAESTKKRCAEGRSGMQGKKHSPETLAKMAEARRKYYENKRNYP